LPVAASAGRAGTSTSPVFCTRSRSAPAEFLITKLPPAGMVMLTSAAWAAGLKIPALMHSDQRRRGGMGKLRRSMVQMLLG
jgi:hypothetical protein